MKEIKNLRLFNKIVRKYWKRHAIKRVWVYKGRKHYFWEVWRVWCYYVSKDPKEWETSIAYKYLSYEMEEKNIPMFIEKYRSIVGENIKINSTYGIFLGFVFTNSGTLFAIQEKRKISFWYLTNEIEKENIILS